MSIIKSAKPSLIQPSFKYIRFIFALYICTTLKLGYNPKLLTKRAGSMWKLIFLGLIVWLAIYILKRAINPDSNRQNNEAAASNKSNEDSIENMVQCTACHVHLPRSEAYLVDGNFYCSKAHIENK